MTLIEKSSSEISRQLLSELNPSAAFLTSSTSSASKSFISNTSGREVSDLQQDHYGSQADILSTMHQLVLTRDKCAKVSESRLKEIGPQLETLTSQLQSAERFNSILEVRKINLENWQVVLKDLLEAKTPFPPQERTCFEKKAARNEGYLKEVETDLEKESHKRAKLTSRYIYLKMAKDYYSERQRTDRPSFSKRLEALSTALERSRQQHLLKENESSLAAAKSVQLPPKTDNVSSRKRRRSVD